MANVKVTDIKTRVRALCVAFRNASNNPLGTDISDGAVIATYPAYMVEMFEAARDGTRGRRKVGRQCVITVYVTEVADMTNDTEVETAKDSCYAWIDDLADFFSERPRLELDDGAPLPGVDSIGEVADTGAAVFPPKKGKPHGAFAVSFPVVYARA